MYLVTDKVHVSPRIHPLPAHVIQDTVVQHAESVHAILPVIMDFVTHQIQMHLRFVIAMSITRMRTPPPSVVFQRVVMAHIHGWIRFRIRRGLVFARTRDSSIPDAIRLSAQQQFRVGHNAEP
jgi:hypothetical protein